MVAASRSISPACPSRRSCRLAAVLDALIEVSSEPDATRRLGAPASLSDVVRRNVGLRDVPTAPAGVVYSGVLYDAIGLADLDPSARRRARAWIVVISALWGAVRLGDRIPAYRLNMCGRLPGLAHLTDVWRGPLADVLPAAAGRGLVVDCRSAEYATAWRPAGALAERTVILECCVTTTPSAARSRTTPSTPGGWWSPDRHRGHRSAPAGGTGGRPLSALQGGPPPPAASRASVGAARHRTGVLTRRRARARPAGSAGRLKSTSAVGTVRPGPPGAADSLQYVLV